MLVPGWYHKLRKRSVSCGGCAEACRNNCAVTSGAYITYLLSRSRQLGRISVRGASQILRKGTACYSWQPPFAEFMEGQIPWVEDVSPYLVRVFGRDQAYGIFISNSAFTDPWQRFLLMVESA